MAGGLVQMPGPDCNDTPEHWLPFLAVDDVDARLKKAVAGGASVIREPFDVEGVGRIAILREPGGAAVGWMTPAKS
jgi:predicted enzyme related to lactoylglutathione lyase